MGKVKAIALDFGGVLIVQNDYPKTIPYGEVLEDNFDYKVGGVNFWEWAEGWTGKSRKELEIICRDIVMNSYTLREENIFSKLPKVKLALASNHLGLVREWLVKNKLDVYFDSIIISEEIKCQKPDRCFYEKLAASLNLKPFEILFVDDSLVNISVAKKLGFITLHYRSDSILSISIQEKFNSIK